MTGLPCSGKTTIARNLSKHITNLAVLDGDELREWLSPNEDFSQDGIKNHNKRVSKLVKLLLDHNVQVCVSKINPYAEDDLNERYLKGEVIDFDSLECMFQNVSWCTVSPNTIFFL